MEDCSSVDCSFEKQPFKRNYGLAVKTAGLETFVDIKMFTRFACRKNGFRSVIAASICVIKLGSCTKFKTGAGKRNRKDLYWLEPNLCICCSKQTSTYN